MVRYFGWYSNKSRGVRAKRQRPAPDPAIAARRVDRPPTSAHWRRLIAKIWQTDPLLCPNCGAQMKIVSFIEDRRVIERILRHLGLLNSPATRAPPDDIRHEPFLDDLPAVEEQQVVREPF